MKLSLADSSPRGTLSAFWGEQQAAVTFCVAAACIFSQGPWTDQHVEESKFQETTKRDAPLGAHDIAELLLGDFKWWGAVARWDFGVTIFRQAAVDGAFGTAT